MLIRIAYYPIRIFITYPDVRNLSENRRTTPSQPTRARNREDPRSCRFHTSPSFGA